MKVLLIGHACSPYAGSEPGLTWNWAWQLAQQHDVWLIAHPHFRDAVDRHLETHANPHLRVRWASVASALDPWNPAHGERGLRLHYIIWLQYAHRLAAQIVTAEHVDIVHHVSLGTVGVPPPFWRLPVPFVWGPLGGGQTAPAAFRAYFGADWRHEQLRALRIRLAAGGPLRFAARRSVCILATNHETEALLRRAGAIDVRIFSDNGVRQVHDRPTDRAGRKDGLATILWAGRHESRKGLPLLLEALVRLRDVPVRVLVAGDGPRRRQWQEESSALGLDPFVTFLGRVSADRMNALFAEADLMVFTSLQDFLGSVTLDALANGLPLISLDHQGQRAIIPANAAVKIPVTVPKETVSRLADALLRLVYSPERRAELSRNAVAFARSLLWVERAQAVTRIYAEKLKAPGTERPTRQRSARHPVSSFPS